MVSLCVELVRTGIVATDKLGMQSPVTHIALKQSHGYKAIVNSEQKQLAQPQILTSKSSVGQ